MTDSTYYPGDYIMGDSMAKSVVSTSALASKLGNRNSINVVRQRQPSQDYWQDETGEGEGRVRTPELVNQQESSRLTRRSYPVMPEEPLKRRLLPRYTGDGGHWETRDPQPQPQVLGPRAETSYEANGQVNPAKRFVESASVGMRYSPPIGPGELASNDRAPCLGHNFELPSTWPEPKLDEYGWPIPWTSHDVPDTWGRVQGNPLTNTEWSH